nr:MAG: hypothetical protein [Microvirus sp.]
MSTIAEKLKKMLDLSLSRPRVGTHDEEGRLICDPNPLKFPVGFKKPPSREEQLHQILRNHKDMMTFNARYEDETDFDIDHDDMLTPFERHAHVYNMEPETPVEPPRSAPQNAGEEEAQPSPQGETDGSK